MSNQQLFANKKYLSSWAGSLRKGSGAPSAKNLANAFTPMEPMTREGMNPERIRAMGDVPKALKQALDQGMERIGLSCLKGNAAILLSVYEDI